MKYLLLALCTSLTAPAHAKCTAAQEHIISCMAGKKQLELCFNPHSEKLTYRFGPIGAPDLELERDAGDVRFRPWNGTGSAIWEYVQLDNKGYTYEVLVGYERNERRGFAGVTVFRDETELASFECENGGGAFLFDPLADALRERGYCTPDNGYMIKDASCE
jgi:hypothetical protein